MAGKYHKGKYITATVEANKFYHQGDFLIQLHLHSCTFNHSQHSLLHPLSPCLDN